MISTDSVAAQMLKACAQFYEAGWMVVYSIIHGFGCLMGSCLFDWNACSILL